MHRLRHRFNLWFHTRRIKQRSRRTVKPVFDPRIFSVVTLTALVFILGIVYINNHLRPIMTQMASVQVDQIASRVINQAIADKISEEGVSYSNLILFEKDIYGQITALKTDIVSVNKIKASVIDEVLSALEGIDSSKLAIPLGNLINSDLLSGRGPKIPLKIVPLGTVTASFSNQFSSAGINQTRHQIMMDVMVDISVLLPGYSIGTKVSTQISIAETIIVGSVPDSYVQFDNSSF